MKLLDILSKKKQDTSIEHEINPVYDTAKNCLGNLAQAQCAEAICLNSVLHFTDKTTATNAITKGTALFQETRYQFVNEQILKSGITNILDIGCGYSPRGILFAEMGYNYVGADLPAAIREVEPAVMKCASTEAAALIKYVGLDATDPEALVRAAASLEGSVCIITEGLMMYFPIYELNEYVKGLKRILEAHGGCIITPDFCMNRLLQLSSAAFSWKPIGKLLQKGATHVVKDYYIATNNEMDPSAWYAQETDNVPFEYFTNAGFAIKRVAVYEPGMKLNMLAGIKPIRKKKLCNQLAQTYGWIITLK